MNVISVEDAIKTTWMILEGLGYKRDENYELSDTVYEVFRTAPIHAVDARSAFTNLCGKCGTCKHFTYESAFASTGFCDGRKASKGRIMRTNFCPEYEEREVRHE